MSFCPQLEQSQKEASDLLEQNRLLQDQLRVALGREQSAREGYVLQVGRRVPRPSRCARGLQREGRRLPGGVQRCEQGHLARTAPLGSSAQFTGPCVFLLLLSGSGQSAETSTSKAFSLLMK